MSDLEAIVQKIRDFFRTLYINFMKPVNFVQQVYLGKKIQIFVPPSEPRLEVFFNRDLDGGGRTFGMDFFRILDVIEYSPRGNIMEWCSGPGFIGFSIYNKFKEQITSLELVDINPAAIKLCKKTIRKNSLDIVTAVTSNSVLNSLDFTQTEYLSLIVSNPPHFSKSIDAYRNYVNDIRVYDLAWTAHKRFFREIVTRMDYESIIILQENNRGSTCSEFSKILSEIPTLDNGRTQHLEIVQVIDCKGIRTTEDHFYYLILRLAPAQNSMEYSPK